MDKVCEHDIEDCIYCNPEATGVGMIAEKFRTNREHKGYTAEHDDGYDQGELIIAAECYLEWIRMQMHFGPISELLSPGTWPFEPSSWKPSDDPVRNLVHAGALIAAEIDRLQRLKP